MASSHAFEWLCNELEEATDLDRLESRGTVRLALRQAGLEAAHVTAEQLAVVLANLMPGELGSRGISNPEAVCESLIARLPSLPADAPEADSPAAVFSRMA